MSTNNRTNGTNRPGGMGRPGGGSRHGGHMGPIVKAKDTRGTLKRLWSYLGIYKLSLIAVIIIVCVTTALTLMGPYLIGYAIDHFIVTVDLEGLARVIGLMIVIYLLSALTTWLQNYIMIGISQKAIREIRNDMFEKFQSLSLGYFDRHSTGDLMSRLVNDVQTISNTISQSVTQFISSLLTVVGVVIVMFMINWRLALITTLTVPVVIFLIKKVASRTRKGFKAQQENLGVLNGIIEESISGQKIIKAYGHESEVIDEFESANDTFKKSAVQAQIFAGVVGPMMNAINNMNYAIVVGSGGLMAAYGYATVGTIASFMTYSKQFSRPINQIASLYNTIQAAIASAERVFELMDETPEIMDTENAIIKDRIKGDVQFNDVHFGYMKDVKVLKDVNIDVQAGQTIALVGPTGSGKTTIINLLTRFYDVNKGDIKIDGIDIRDMSKEHLRQRLGIVLQDTYLFSGTVKENILYGKLDATDEEVCEAARLANADQFIHRLPHGYDTVLTEEGSNLSQGQRQLISIARVILANSDILILDEATSNVDTRTEMHIQEAMLELTKGRTSFVIAHRLKTIQNADMILVVKDGEIIERGSHETLLKLEGFYHNMYTSQFKGKAALMMGV